MILSVFFLFDGLFDDTENSDVIKIWDNSFYYYCIN